LSDSNLLGPNSFFNPLKDMSRFWFDYISICIVLCKYREGVFYLERSVFIVP